ncbi:unnamed protein product [Auanema sp. JU1783]|nr:unnamed protein product [Auanema sp. JU1783]
MSSTMAKPAFNGSFPQRNDSSTTNSEFSGSQHSLRSNEDINSILQPATRFAFADLITSILRLDFWNENDPHSIFFCKVAFQTIIAIMDLPDKTIKTLKLNLEDEQMIGDITEMITSIKADPLVKENGSLQLIGSVILSVLQSGNYDSRYRVLLRHLATLLAVSWDDVEELEDSLVGSSIDDEYVESEYSRKARESKQRNKKIKRYLLIGAAGGVGGVLIGLTGGLAAPLVASGVGALLGTGTLAGLTTAAGAAALGTSFGIAGAGLSGYKMKKRVGAIEEFSVESLTDGSSLHCVLVVSGWIDRDTTPETAFVHQWRHLCHSREQYTLRYESKYLTELGNAIQYMMGFAVSVAIQQTLMETALAGLMTAVAWPVALLSCASVLDNPWNVCIARAAEVGEHLAEVLLSRSHGKRPITLIGFSLGARVIFHCLLALSKRVESVGIIEDVVLLGAPVTASPKQWAQLSTVVGGRIINGYCETDWLLRFLYRTMSVQFRIAGTGPIDNKENKKIYNYNLSHIVKGHMDYARRLTEVLNAVSVRVGPHSEDSVIDLAELSYSAENMTKEAQDKSNGKLTEDVISKIDEVHISDDHKPCLFTQNDSSSSISDENTSM